MTRPDILFIVLDTQRADRLGCYGYEKAFTPQIDQFASQAILFEQAISPAQWTIPSHASMFSGLYPTAHQVTQSNHRLGPDTPHLVEALQRSGYETVAFCNNPLVGVLDNGLKRGFEQFYNYGGAFPMLPPDPRRQRNVLRQLQDRFEGVMRRIAQPIQNLFGNSRLALRISLNLGLTYMWSRWLNFKGQNERSIGDVVRYLDWRDEQVVAGEEERPLFLFLNLMQTHMPFIPPKEYVDKAAPYMRTDREARRIMSIWNQEAYRWSAPVPEGLSELERRVLSDMYDAEVAYQDAYLQHFFAALERRGNLDNTLVVFVGDHGDGLGEHNYFGHSFVAYQELLHVPLLMSWPRKKARAARVSQPVSTRRIFHTLLDAAEADMQLHGISETELRALSLWEVVEGRDAEEALAYSEVYPPLNIVYTIEQRQPELVEALRLNEVRRTVVHHDLKFIQMDDDPYELFDLTEDRLELENVLEARPVESSRLNQHLNRITHTVEAQRDSLIAGEPLDLESDAALMQRLRGLGYIE